MIKRFSFISLLFCSFLFAPMSITWALEIGDTAPNFTLKSRDGKNVKLSEYRGSVVMLNFWASWCGPCRQEMPLLEKMSKRYGKLGFVLLGVNTEGDPTLANNFLKDITVTFPILYDTSKKVSQDYGVSAMPTTVIVDRNGKVRYIHYGYKSGDEKKYKKAIKKLIRE